MIDPMQLAIIPSGESLMPTGAELLVVAEEPCPTLLFTWPEDWDKLDNFVLTVIALNYGRMRQPPVTALQFRCVGIDRLTTIQATGCDVTPTNTVIWVDKRTQKAMEYGGETKVMMVFDAKQLKNAGLDVPVNVNIEELQRLRLEYPTMLTTVDGQYLRLSRLPESDKRAGSSHEIAHGRWISGDPWKALILLIILAHDHEALQDRP